MSSSSCCIRRDSRWSGSFPPGHRCACLKRDRCKYYVSRQCSITVPARERVPTNQQNPTSMRRPTHWPVRLSVCPRPVELLRRMSWQLPRRFQRECDSSVHGKERYRGSRLHGSPGTVQCLEILRRSDADLPTLSRLDEVHAERHSWWKARSRDTWSTPKACRHDPAG